MAIEIFKLVGSIMVDNDKAKKSISDTGKTAEDTGGKFDKLGDLAKKAAGVIGTVFTVKAIADFGKTCINAAEALEQTMKKTDVIFGDSAEAVNDWALANERSFGLGSGTIAGYMNSIADITQGMGMAKEASVDMAKGATELGVQLANWNGIDAATAINDIQSAMTGSTKGLEKYGIKINDAAKEQAMLSLGLSGTYDKLDNATKAQVIYQAALEASGNAVDYWNEGNRSMGFYLNEAKEQFGNITETIGAFFLPLAKKGAEMFADFVSNANLFVVKISDAINSFKEGMEQGEDIVDNIWFVFKEVFGIEIPDTVLDMISNVVEYWQSLWDIVVDLWNTLGQPIFNIIKEIFLDLMANSDIIFNAISTYFQIMTDSIKVVWESILKPVFDFIVDIIQTTKQYFDENCSGMSTIFNDFVVTIKSFWEGALKPVLQAIGDFIKNILLPAFKYVFENGILPIVGNVFKGIGDVWNNSLKPILNGIIEFVQGVFSGNWSRAWEGVVSIVKGIFSGIVTAVKSPINTVIGIINNFINGLNKLQVPDWVPAIGGKGINIPNIPMLYKGTDYFKGGMAIVGEQGPELVEMPRGSRVYTASETKEKLSSGNTYNFYSNEKLSEREIMRQQRNLERQLGLGLA
ncbi:hypothetical protein [Clostridium sp. D53t1_180928_C8]|uniref:phage tail protein n=1 Tax=Clostridium sp. D53t1_180928_C8 TaxID=2787101 RepID=UPI0018AB4016|nr:hypothetical protein [Clostridium sp. D53t1_180928_C8]